MGPTVLLVAMLLLSGAFFAHALRRYRYGKISNEDDDGDDDDDDDEKGEEGDAASEEGDEGDEEEQDPPLDAKVSHHQPLRYTIE